MHPYHGLPVALVTKHGKERVIGPPLARDPGLCLVQTGIDNDQFGTFTGEIERTGTPRETALAKARLGIEVAGLPRAIASEGSFGPHPEIGFVPAGHEILAFVDAERQTEIVVQRLALRTNYAQTTASRIDELERFLHVVRFPSHALIARPNTGENTPPDKGLTTNAELQGAIRRHARSSDDGLARVETDMRAHLNPTRAREIGLLARELARRLATQCPACDTPGWGITDAIRGLPCEECGHPTDLVAVEIHGCPSCPERQRRGRADARRHADPGHCPYCNP
jgi:hypothetical protein